MLPVYDCVMFSTMFSLQLCFFFLSPLVDAKWSYTPIDAKFTSIAVSSDGASAYAAAAATNQVPGGIWMTKGGNVWDKSLNASEEYIWSSISCSSSGSIVYATAGIQGVFISNDYSATFKLAPGTGGSSNWVDVATDASGTYAYVIDNEAIDGVVNYDLHIIGTADAGQTWFNSQLPQTSFPLGYGKSITSSSDGRYVAAAVYGYILISSDYGKKFDVSFTRGGQYAKFYEFTSITSSYSGESIFTSTEAPNAVIMKNSNYGEHSWQELEDTQGKQFTCVTSDSSGAYLYATTEGPVGTVYLSNDGGDNWDPIVGDDVLVNQDYRAVATTEDGFSVYVVADNGIYFSDNVPDAPIFMPTNFPVTEPTMNSPTLEPTAGSQTWVQTESPELGWTSTATARSNPAIVLGVGYGTNEETYENQGIWLSKDFGSSFSQVYKNSDVIWVSVAVSYNGTYAYALARPGGIFVSKDTGESWNLVPGTVNDLWNSVTTDSTGQLVYAVTQKNDAYFSKDYGDTFNLIESLSNSGVSQWGAVTTSSNGQYVYISTFENSVYSSTDNGESFTKIEDIEVGDNNGYLSGIITSYDGQYVYVCGQNTGYIHRSSDFGQTFQTTNAPVANWRSITASSTGMDVYAVSNSGRGGDGGVYHSSSYGETFEQITDANDVVNIPSYTSICTSDDGDVIYASNTMYIYSAK